MSPLTDALCIVIIIISLVQRSPAACLIVCVITENPKGALCSKLGTKGK
jgi:hypothetical protein